VYRRKEGSWQYRLSEEMRGDETQSQRGILSGSDEGKRRQETYLSFVCLLPETGSGIHVEERKAGSSVVG
jgi:hypothetical protein